MAKVVPNGGLVPRLGNLMGHIISQSMKNMFGAYPRLSYLSYSCSQHINIDMKTKNFYWNKIENTLAHFSNSCRIHLWLILPIGSTSLTLLCVVENAACLVG